MREWEREYRRVSVNAVEYGYVRMGMYGRMRMWVREWDCESMKEWKKEYGRMGMWVWGMGMGLTALNLLSRSLRRCMVSGWRAWLSRVEETLERKRASVRRPLQREDHSVASSLDGGRGYWATLSPLSTLSLCTALWSTLCLIIKILWS